MLLNNKAALIATSVALVLVASVISHVKAAPQSSSASVNRGFASSSANSIGYNRKQNTFYEQKIGKWGAFGDNQLKITEQHQVYDSRIYTALGLLGSQKVSIECGDHRQFESLPSVYDDRSILFYYSCMNTRFNTEQYKQARDIVGCPVKHYPTGWGHVCYVIPNLKSIRRMNTDIMRSRMPTILSKTLPFSSFYWAPPPEKQVKAVIDDLAKQVIIGVNYATKLGFYYDSSYGYNVNVIHAQDPSRRTISYSARFGFSPRFRVLVVNEDYYRIEAKNVLDRFYMKNENNLRPATLVDTHRTISNLIREILLPTPADFIWKAPAPIRDLLAEAELQNMDPEDIIPEGPLSAEEYSRFYERALNRDLEFQNRVWSTSSLKFEFLPPYVDEKTFKQQQQHQHQQFNPSSFTTMQNLPPPPPYDSSIQAREIPQSPLRP